MGAGFMVPALQVLRALFARPVGEGASIGIEEKVAAGIAGAKLGRAE